MTCPGTSESSIGVGPSHLTRLSDADRCCQTGDQGGEGFGAQCGFHFNFSFGVGYTFNISLAESNATSAVFTATVTAEDTGEATLLGAIGVRKGLDVVGMAKGHDCDRIIVDYPLGVFQEPIGKATANSHARWEGPVAVVPGRAEPLVPSRLVGGAGSEPLGAGLWQPGKSPWCCVNSACESTAEDPSVQSRVTHACGLLWTDGCKNQSDPSGPNCNVQGEGCPRCKNETACALPSPMLRSLA